MAAKKIMTMLQASALQKQSPTFHAGSSRSWRFASFGSGSKCQINPEIETSQNQAFGGLKRKWTKWTLSDSIYSQFPKFLVSRFHEFHGCPGPRWLVPCSCEPRGHRGGDSCHGALKGTTESPLKWL